MNLALLNNLELVSTSKDGVKKIRQLILDLAVRGKLVPQDPNDEPASELLKKIQSEKQKLIAEGKIKKDKPLPPVTKEEKPFDLPKGWEWARLGLTGNIFNGNSINENVKQTLYSKNIKGYPYIATKDVGYGLTQLDYENGIKIPHSETKFKIATKDTILICSEGGSAGKKIGIANQDICFGNKLYANKLWSELDPKYFLYLYQSQIFYSAFRSRMTGIIGGISINEFNNICIPIPPKNEQIKISHQLDELMKICDELENQQIQSEQTHKTLLKTFLGVLSNSQSPKEFQENWKRIEENFDTLFTTEESIDELKKTILQLAVMGKLVPQDPNDEPASELLKKIQSEKQKLITEGKIKKEKPLPPITDEDKPFNLPDAWEWVKIGNYVLQTDYGTSEKSYNITEGVRVLGMGHIQDGKVVLDNCKRVRSNAEGLPELFLKNKDLLYNRTNSAELVGKTGIYTGKDDAFTFASYLIRLSPSTLSNPIYLNLVMNSWLFRETQVVPHLKQQCGQANVNGTILKNMIVQIPPVAEQNRIVAKVDELISLCDTLKSKITESKNIQNQMSVNF